MKHWLSEVVDILTSDTGDLKRLASIAGFEHNNFYKYQDLSKCDLRGQDLRGIDFTGCNLENAKIDQYTFIDPSFDPRIVEYQFRKVRINVSSHFNTLILHYMQEINLKDKNEAYRYLFSIGLEKFRSRQKQFYEEIITSNDNLCSVLKTKKISSVPIDVEIRLNLIEKSKNHLDILDTELIKKIIVIGLISRKIKFRDKKSYSGLSLNAFYPPKLIRVDGSDSLK